MFKQLIGSIKILISFFKKDYGCGRRSYAVRAVHPFELLKKEVQPVHIRNKLGRQQIVKIKNRCNG